MNTSRVLGAKTVTEMVIDYSNRLQIGIYSNGAEE